MKNKTEIIVVLDRSGSMQTIKNDMEGGFKKFLEEQKAQPGECTMSLFSFDNATEVLYQDLDIKSINAIIIDPRGGTALLDAICHAIDQTGARLAAKKPEDRPERVLVYVISDGGENSSRRFNKAQTEAKIKHQESTYSWKFMFLGCSFDMIGEASKFGGSFENSVNFAASKKGIDKGFEILSKSASFYRSVDAQNLSASTYAVTREDREEAEDKK
jgi:uncharacterized protein YegL